MAYDTPDGLSILFIKANEDPTAYVVESSGVINQNGVADTAVNTAEAGVNNENQQEEGDFNGDGRTDVVFIEEAGGARFIALINNQDGTFTRVTTSSVTAAPNYGFGRGLNEKNHVGDVDGDGLDDIVFMYRENGSNNGIYTYLSNGDGTFSTTPVISQSGTITDA